MGFAQRTLRFGSGLVFGAAIGTAISVLLAPQTGEELKAAIADRIEEAKRAGEEAELVETERLKRLYRDAVRDQSALTGKFDDRKREKTAAEVAAERLQKERDEAEKARRDERRAEEAVTKAQERMRKAEEDARRAHEKAQQEEADVVRAQREAVDKSSQS